MFRTTTSPLHSVALALALCLGPTLRAQAPDVPAAHACNDAFVLPADQQSFPIFVINDFVFLEGDVNGTHGKFMFDTGTRDALALNDHLLNTLGEGTVLGHGRVGSGQTYARTARTCVRGVRIIGMPRFLNVPKVESNDLGFIEKDITPDFLGFIGYDAFAGYSFKLDYVLRRLTFFKGESTPGLSPSFLTGEILVAKLPFTTRKRPDDPFLPVRLGSQTFIAALDTGQSGGLEMTDETRDALLKEGALTKLPAQDNDGQTVYRLNNLQVAEGVRVSLPGLTISPPGSVADKGIGVTESNVIYLGYEFLSQFKTVVDFPGHTIYLLQR